MHDISLTIYIYTNVVVIILTLVEVEDGEGDLVCPGRSLLQPDAVARPAEEVPGRDEVAVARRLELQPRAVPDERVQLPEETNNKHGPRGYFAR